MLDDGNVHSAHEREKVLVPVAERYRGRRIERVVRADATSDRPEVSEYLD